MKWSTLEKILQRTKMQELRTFADMTRQPPLGTISASQLASGTMATPQFGESERAIETNECTRIQVRTALRCKGSLHMSSREGNWLRPISGHIQYERLKLGGQDIYWELQGDWREGSQREENDMGWEESWCATVCKAEGAGSCMSIDHLKQKDRRRRREKLRCCRGYDQIQMMRHFCCVVTGSNLMLKRRVKGVTITAHRKLFVEQPRVNRN